MRDDVQLDTYLVLCERHIDKDVTDEDKHNAQHSERQSLSIVMEVLGNIHIIQSDQCIEILLLDLHVSQLSHLHHQLHFLLFSKCLIHKDVFEVVSLLGVDLEVLLVLIPLLLLLFHFFIVLRVFISILLSIIV